MSGARILVADDDPAILRAVRRGLGGAGFDVTGVATAAEVLPAFNRLHPDVVVLDLVLPDGDGIELCAEIRRRATTPVIVLSAIGDDARKVEALNTGADDYVVKPFSMAELQARINAAIRRSTPQASTILEVDVLKLDLLSRKVTAHGEEVHLTPTEFELLRLLMTYPGRVFTQRHLLASVWGAEYQDDAHILRTFIHQLRSKLSAASEGAGALLVNDPGIGYRLEPERPEGPNP
jgi:two-component system KDP operon response regulator KdpE